MALAELNRFFDIKRADDAIFGGADREVDEADAPARPWDLVAVFVFAPGEIGPGLAAEGIIVEGRIRNDIDLGQQGGQGAGGGGLAGAALAANQNAADPHVNGVKDQGEFHHVLADNGGEGIDGRSLAHISDGFLNSRSN